MVGLPKEQRMTMILSTMMMTKANKQPVPGLYSVEIYGQLKDLIDLILIDLDCFDFDCCFCFFLFVTFQLINGHFPCYKQTA